MPGVRHVDHPVVRHHLAVMRDRDTGADGFRRAMDRATTVLTCTATDDLPTEDFALTTPVAETVGRRLVGRVGIVPILRAGLGMVAPMLDLLPQAEVWHLGYRRDETTLRPQAYYKRLPPGDPTAVAFVVDPMLATGGSAIAALQELRTWGVPDLRLMTLLAAPEGVAAVREKFPDVTLVVGAIDERLNERGYIVPGLGDAGDRYFNAVPD